MRPEAGPGRADGGSGCHVASPLREVASMQLLAVAGRLTSLSGITTLGVGPPAVNLAPNPCPWRGQSPRAGAGGLDGEGSGDLEPAGAAGWGAVPTTGGWAGQTRGQRDPPLPAGGDLPVLSLAAHEPLPSGVLRTVLPGPGVVRRTGTDNPPLAVYLAPGVPGGTRLVPVPVTLFPGAGRSGEATASAPGAPAGRNAGRPTGSACAA